jgi:hypothetical protein
MRSDVVEKRWERAKWSNYVHMLLCTFLIPVLWVTQAGRLSSVATISMKDVGKIIALNSLN